MYAFQPQNNRKRGTRTHLSSKWELQVAKQVRSPKDHNSIINPRWIRIIPQDTTYLEVGPKGGDKV